MIEFTTNLENINEDQLKGSFCDEELILYYEKQGMKKATGALIRNYENQNGRGGQ